MIDKKRLFLPSLRESWAEKAQEMARIDLKNNERNGIIGSEYKFSIRSEVP